MERNWKRYVLKVEIPPEYVNLIFQFLVDETGLNEVINQLVENTPGVVPLQQIAPNAIIIYGKYIPVERKYRVFGI